jgi:hypothetical protein
MPQRKTPLKPIRKGKTDPKEFARQVRGINDRLKAEGRTFADSTKIVRADRDSHV